LSVPDELLFREIEPGDGVTGFSLGEDAHQPLKIFLRKCAHGFHKNNIAKTYVLVEPREGMSAKVWGYITLVCSEITIEDGYSFEECVEANRYQTFPAVKIARLAVDCRLNRQGCGTSMVDWAISLTKKVIAPKVGCRFLIVDSKRDAVSFYETVGFTILDTDRNRKSKHPVLFVDLHRITA